jgi:hypothetical protein
MLMVWKEKSNLLKGSDIDQYLERSLRCFAYELPIAQPEPVSPEAAEVVLYNPGGLLVSVVRFFKFGLLSMFFVLHHQVRHLLQVVLSVLDSVKEFFTSLVGSVMIGFQSLVFCHGRFHFAPLLIGSDGRYNASFAEYVILTRLPQKYGNPTLCEKGLACF